MQLHGSASVMLLFGLQNNICACEKVGDKLKIEKTFY
jgi:hypothetical protein